MDTGTSLEKEVEEIIKLLSEKGKIRYVEKFPPWQDKEATPHYEIRLINVNKSVLCEPDIPESKGVIDELFTYIAKEDFIEFVKSAISIGQSTAVCSQIYRNVGYNWKNDLASGTNSSSGYQDKSYRVFLKLSKKDDEEKWDFELKGGEL